MIENLKGIIAIIGLGSISDRHRSNLRLIFPSFEIACLPSSTKKFDGLPSSCDILTDSIEEIIALNPKFAIIASPATFHARHSIPFIENNIPVLIEKPIAANIKDAMQIAEAAKKYETPVGIGYCLRYKPFITQVKNFLENKAIGEIINVEIFAGSYLPDWRPNKDYLDSVSASSMLGGGVLLELSHEIDYANLFFPNLCLESAIIKNSQTLKIDVEDFADLKFSIPGGGKCKIHLDFLQKPSIRHAYFYGSKGKILWDLQNNNLDVTATKLKKSFTIKNWDSNLMYIEMIKDFVLNFIKFKTNKVCNISDALTVIKYIEQANQYKKINKNE
ncbi:Gfo/Idh/MocA family oxidoreductase [Gammaproteobacteria bacterium]|nr:Gfo/Idh/MocA family oxidoreductase [Gammaproteobacteria bacterium]